MKKKLLSAALAVAMALSVVPGAFAAEAVTASPTNDKLTVDGVERNPTVYKIGDSNYFKIRDFAAVLNGTGKQFSVGYDAEKQSVTAAPGQPYELTGTELAGATDSSQTAQASNDAICVNGQRVEAEVYKIDGSNYFKLRDLAYALNGSEKQFDVVWNASANAISLTSGKSYTAAGGELAPGSGAVQEALPTTSALLLDGADLALEAYNINGNNYFKLRDLGSALNFGVDWDGAANTVVIDTAKGYTP